MASETLQPIESLIREMDEFQAETTTNRSDRVAGNVI